MCAHNPTGVDPTPDQWRANLAVVQARSLLPLFDAAYQGFVSGDPDEDAWPVRLFVAAGVQVLVACFFAKNFGLYGDRIGALHVICGAPDDVPRVNKTTAPLYSTSTLLYCTASICLLGGLAAARALSVAVLHLSPAGRPHREHHPERPQPPRAVAGRVQSHGGAHRGCAH